MSVAVFTIMAADATVRAVANFSRQKKIVGPSVVKAARKTAAGAVSSRTKRLNVDVRRKQIVREASLLFAEQGFDANTRTLAERLGTTQPLLYRYYPNKDSLIQAVLEELFEKQGAVDWISMITDRSTPLRERLIAFSSQYSSNTYDRTWIRLYMFSGLAGGDFNRRYIASVTEPILRAMAGELRQHAGMTVRRGRSVTQRELDYLWLYHGGLYYFAIRRYIYGLHVDDQSLQELIASSVDNLISGISRFYDTLT